MPKSVFVKDSFWRHNKKDPWEEKKLAHLHWLTSFLGSWEAAAPHHHSAVLLPLLQEELQQLRDREAQQRQKHDEQLKEMRPAGRL